MRFIDRGVARSSRRELRRELRVNLVDAAAVDRVARALRGIGSPRTLAHAVAETSRTRHGGLSAPTLHWGCSSCSC